MNYSLVKLILESESGGEYLYHFTTLLDGLQIVNPNVGSLQWSLAVRKGDGSVPYFSLTSKSSFNSGYPLIQRNSAIAASKDLEDLKVVRITFDKARLENYAVNPYHYDTTEASGSLKAALDMIEDPNDKDEAEVRITRKNREETLQDLRDSITSVDILVADWIYQNFTKTLKTENKFEGLIRSYFDPSKNAFIDETHVVNYKDGKERREAEFWQDKKNSIRTGHRLTSGEQFTNLRTKYGYSDAEIKQLGHLVAYCGQLLSNGALKYFDSLSTDEISAIGDAAEKSPGNADAAKNAYRTLNIQNKFRGQQKAVLKCILNMVDDFEDYLKKEGVLDPNKNYRFDEIVDVVKKEGLIEEKNMKKIFDFRKYLAEDWMHKEARSLEYDDPVYDLLEVPDSTVLQAVADFAFGEPISVDSFEDEEKKEILAFILTDLSRGRYDPEAEAVGPYLKAQIGPRFN